MLKGNIHVAPSRVRELKLAKSGKPGSFDVAPSRVRELKLRGKQLKPGH